MEVMLDGLTKREMEVLRLVVLGYENTEIARNLYVTVHTAKVHVSSIIKKLNAKNRTNTVIRAILMGLISVEDFRELI